MSQEGCYYVLRVGRAGAPRRRGGRAEPRDFAAWAGGALDFQLITTAARI